MLDIVHYAINVQVLLVTVCMVLCAKCFADLAHMLTYLDQSTTTHLDGAKLTPSNTVCIAAAAMALVP